MYNTRKGEPRHKLTKIKRDYCPYILGLYRYGLHQKAPRTNDPDAPPAHRFSQLAEYRFAENNQRFMELYDEQILELRKTRRFLAS